MTTPEFRHIDSGTGWLLLCFFVCHSYGLFYSFVRPIARSFSIKKRSAIFWYLNFNMYLRQSSSNNQITHKHYGRWTLGAIGREMERTSSEWMKKSATWRSFFLDLFFLKTLFFSSMWMCILLSTKFETVPTQPKKKRHRLRHHPKINHEIYKSFSFIHLIAVFWHFSFISAHPFHSFAHSFHGLLLPHFGHFIDLKAPKSWFYLW